MTRTAIEWTDEVWNPVTGCSKVSPGCAHCYAETLSHRFGMTSKPWVPPYAGENVVLHPERLDAPLHWRQPRRVFVNSMSDLFHENVPTWFIDRVFAVMGVAQRHTFQVLTKRPERMQAYVNDRRRGWPPGPNGWPLRNAWLGVSVENQHWADVRVPLLLQTPAAVRFLSCEPLLGPVDLIPYLPGIDWVLVGGESGPKHRPMDVGWARSIITQCRWTDVPAFFKQLGGARPGTALADLPDDLRVREWPRAQSEQVR